MKETFLETNNKIPEVNKREPELPLIMGKLMARAIEEAEKIGIRPEDRNEKGELLVSPEGATSLLGKQSELWWKIARTKSFKDFFGDWQNDPKSSSKIVDSNGEPLVVFRGLSQQISFSDFYDESFYQERITGTEKGVYISPSRKVSAGEGSPYRGEGGTSCLFINSRRPTERDKGKMVMEEMMDEILYIPRKYFKLTLFSKGFYDSILGSNRNVVIGDKSVQFDSKKLEDLYEIVVRSPNQILILPSIINGGSQDDRPEYLKSNSHT